MLVLMPVLPGSQLVSSSVRWASTLPMLSSSPSSSVSSSLPLASSVFIFTTVSSFLPSRPPSTSMSWTSCHFSSLPPVPLNTTTWRRETETYFYNIQSENTKDSKRILWFFHPWRFFQSSQWVTFVLLWIIKMIDFVKTCVCSFSQTILSPSS